MTVANGSAETLPPEVSIVMATYNRPEVLAFAVRSVLAQDFDDWELLIIGDACDASTAQCLAQFQDPRISYSNLALNYGEQSGPNNVGMRRARGHHIAFLNHDDLWFSDHLRTALEWLDASGADLVIARSAVVLPSTEQPGGWWTRVRGMGTAGRYDPTLTIAPASSVLVRTDVVRALGPWLPAADCYSSTSQEWLFRAWRRGYSLRTIPHLSVLIVASGARAQSYVLRDTAEHATFERLLSTPDHLRVMLLDRWNGDLDASWTRSLARPVMTVLAHLGISPLETYARLYQLYPRGSFINELRQVRGLSTLPEREPGVEELRKRYARVAADRERR